MMPHRHSEFSVLMQRVRTRSEGAARDLLERFGEHLLRVVRRRLNPKLRPKFDSLDFVQAVWASFFALPPEQLQFDRPEALAAFLAELARNKVVDVVRQRLQTLKYDLSRERSLEWTADAELRTREPPPEAIAMAREEWSRFLEGKPDRDQTILTSLGEGQAPRQIAADLGLSEKTIRRVLRRARSEKTHEPK